MVVVTEMNGLAHLHGHGSAAGEYSEVESGGGNVVAASARSEYPHQRWRSHAGWIVLWCATLLVAFAIGSSTQGSGQTSAAMTGIVSLDAPQGLAGVDEAHLFRVYEEHFLKARYYDLTHSFSPNSPVWAGFGKAKVKGSIVGADMKGFAKKGDEWSYLQHGFVATSYALTTDQYGTQLDPPAHWNEYGATISDLPPTIAVRPLVIINLVPKVEHDAGYHAGVEDVKAWEKAHGRVPEGSVVFFRSDWSRKWDSYENAMPTTFPGVKLETLKYLHNERKILFHGHEPLDTDMTATLEGEAWLMHNNFAQAEGVANLHKVPEASCLVSIGYAKALGGSGGYARFVAICPQHGTSGGSTIEESPGAPLPRQPHPLRRNADGVLAPDPKAKDTAYCSIHTALGCDAAKKPVWARSQIPDRDHE